MIEPIEDQPGMYRVRLTGDEHIVDATTGVCDCKHYTFRLAGKVGSLCRHGEALAEYLDSQTRCPACQGRGAFAPRCRYQNMTVIPCAACEGSGLRESHRDVEATLSESDLGKMFS